MRVGDKINYLTMIAEPYYRENGKKYALFRCDCGNEKEIRIDNVTNPKGTKSCGCFGKASRRGSKRHLTHGMCRSRICQIWYKMRQRCNNPNYVEFQYYGGRGIKLCPEWERDFMSFYTWAMENGYNDNLSIDRIDVNGGYSPNNCRWATPEEQANNKRNNILLTVDGEEMTLSMWCKRLNIEYSNALARYHKGCTTKQILQIK